MVNRLMADIVPVANQRLTQSLGRNIIIEVRRTLIILEVCSCTCSCTCLLFSIHVHVLKREREREREREIRPARDKCRPLHKK